LPLVALLSEIFNRKLFNTYRRVFDTDNPDVRIILKDLCDEHHVFDSGFSPDPYIHAFAAGERNPILRILTILHLSSEEIAELSTED